MKNLLLLITFLTGILVPLSTKAQNCPGATRTVSNCKASTPNDAIGVAMKDFFQSGGGASATWRFESGATFVENTDGTARLRGVLAYYDKPTTHRFDVDITFIGQTFTPPMGSPVLMNTSPSTAGWYYYNWGAATMTGLGDLAGAKLNLKMRGKAFQVGIGGADQVVDVAKFGATGWFSWEIVSQPTNTAIKINSFPANPAVDQADICIGLSGTPTNCGADPCATDATAPVISGCPANISLSTAGTCANATWTAPTASDNCSTPTLSLTTAPTAGLRNGDCFPIGVTTVTITATDAKGNKSTCSFTVTVTKTVDPCATDVTAPIFANCPANISVITQFTTDNCAIVTWTAPTASDNCSTPTVSITTAPTAGLVMGACYPVGVTTVTYTATDAKGNKATCTFTITVIKKVDPCVGDVTPPTLTNCPADITVKTRFLDDNCAVVTWVAPTATDNCAVTALVLSTSPTAGLAMGGCFPIGVTTATYTAFDAAGNKTTCSFKITVTSDNPCIGDVTPPTLVGCPTNISLTTTGTCANATWTAPRATDNCGTPTLSFVTSPTTGLTNGACFPVGVTTVTYTATDSRNNKTTCSFTVTVTKTDPCATDVTPPVFSNCPANITLSTGGLCVITTWTAPTATDNCSLQSTVFATSPTVGLNNGGCFPVGVTTVTYTATDAKGNKATCVFNVTVTTTCAQIVDPGTIAGDEDFCPGSFVSPVLERTPASGGSGAIEYMWMYSTNTNVFNPATWRVIDGETGKDLRNVPTLTSTAYIIRCVRRAGCDLFAESNTITKKVKSSAAITKGPFSACVGTEVTFEAGDLGVSSATYAWYFQGADISTSSSRIVKVKFTSAGTKKVTLEVYNLGCVRSVSRDITVTSCLVGGSGLMQSFNLSVASTHNVKLNWITADEQLPSKYVVERSSDGKTFASIAEMKSQNSAKNLYDFNDSDPKMGRSYYRIKHIESDGTISFSEMKKSIIYINGGDNVMTYPNPVNNQLFVEVLDTENTEGVIEIYSSMGSLMKSQKFTKEQVRYELDMSELPIGSYILKIRQNNGDSKSAKINKF